jgi:hypothetical protein
LHNNSSSIKKLKELHPLYPLKTTDARLRKHKRVLPGDPIVVVSDIATGGETVSSVQVRVFE